jgi:hypothetical protein
LVIALLKNEPAIFESRCVEPSQGAPRSASPLVWVARKRAPPENAERLRVLLSAGVQ